MHHRSADFRPTARPAAVSADRYRSRRAPRRRAGRLVLGMALSATVTGFALAAPVVASGPPEPPPTMSLDATGSSAARSADEPAPVVVMGRDGPAAPASAVGDAVADPPAAGAPVPVPAAVPLPPDTPDPQADGPVDTADEPVGTVTSSPGSSAGAQAPPAGEPPAGEPATEREAEVLTLVNISRAAAGCPPLVADEALATVARAHSADMRDRGFFSHVNPDGLDPAGRAEAAGRTARAENIATGQRDPAAVMAVWLESSSHRANILHCELRTVGIGLAEGSGGTFWTQLFGS